MLLAGMVSAEDVSLTGLQVLEVITYHALALGFIATAFKPVQEKLNKKRSAEVFNTGVTTVSTYLLQGMVGMIITMIAAAVLNNFFAAAGLLLPFGYGQGTGQALNWGNIYEQDFGFVNGKSFGLTIAALGFLSAAIGGVIHLNIMKSSGKLKLSKRTDGSLHTEAIEDENEIPMQESVDKLTVQLAFILVAYALTYLMIYGLSLLIPGMKATIYGFNFLLGVLSATIVKVIVKFLQNKKLVTRK